MTTTHETLTKLRQHRWKGCVPLLLSAIGLTVLAGCSAMRGESAPQACAERGPEIACTGQGAIRGASEGKTIAFKGIPYAAAPVGSLRFRPPVAPAAWQGVRDGTRFGAVCPQIDGNDVIGDEDCLSLNVWKPQEASSRPLPVMVFLTGGGNHAFSGQGSPGFGGINYNGQALVPEGVVYVSFNARLGALGYLAHPALGAQRADKASGNYGSLDQIAMLQWLKRNIGAFGGDPDRIFLFGTSAGGGNLCALMTAPAARGLFHGVSMQSSVPTGCEIQTLADAEQGSGRRVAQTLGCDQSADPAGCLRSKPMKDIVQALPGTFGVFPRLYGPNMDGVVFPKQPLDMVKARDYTAMPVIIGNSTDETMQFINAAGPVTDAASYAAAIAKVFGKAAATRIVETYSAAAFPTPRAAFVKLTTDALFTCQSRRVGRTLSSMQNQPVYRYLFSHALENDPQQKALGAVHTVEHAFFFPWQGSYKPTATDLDIQQRMITYWTHMAKQSEPGSAKGVSWPKLASGNDIYLEISSTTAVKAGSQDAHCDFWDGVTLPWPHL